MGNAVQRYGNFVKRPTFLPVFFPKGENKPFPRRSFPCFPALGFSFRGACRLQDMGTAFLLIISDARHPRGSRASPYVFWRVSGILIVDGEFQTLDDVDAGLQAFNHVLSGLQVNAAHEGPSGREDGQIAFPAAFNDEQAVGGAHL